MASIALELEGVSKRFGATHALSNARLRIRKGTLHVLLGENGAGKTTLMRVAYGLTRADSAVVRVDGRPGRIESPAAAIRHGIGMVQQHFSIVPAMTVAENIALGDVGRFSLRTVARRLDAIGNATGLSLDPAARASSLSLSGQQQLEIIKALVRNAQILILDEPTAVLAPTDAARLLERLRLLADSGIAVVLITHKLNEALAVADELTVLRRGTTVLSAPTVEVSPPDLVAAMIGPGGLVASPDGSVDLNQRRDIGEERRTQHAAGQPVAEAVRITVTDDRGIHRVRGVTLEVCSGEIIGIAGIEGSGVRELLRALGDRLRIHSGTLAMPKEIGFVPEDRHRDALALDLTLTENVALRGAGQRSGFVGWRAMRERTKRLLEDFAVVAAGPDALARTLSGGNQQKLVLGRELEATPRLLIVENPTRGLDLRASAAIHTRLRLARDAGAAIVLYSSDLDELVALAGRTFAMYAGALTETSRDRGSIGEAMLGRYSVKGESLG